MVTILVWFAAILIILATIAFLRLAYGTKIIFTPLNLYMAYYLILVFPGSVYVYQSKGSTEIIYLVMMGTGAFLPVLIPALLSALRGKGWDVFRIAEERFGKGKIILLFLSGVTISLVSFYVVQSRFPISPLSMMLKGDFGSAFNIAEARERFIYHSDGFFRNLSLLTRVILPVLSMFAWEAYRLRKDIFSLITFFLLTVFTTILLAISGSKALCVHYWISLLVFYYARRGFRVAGKDFRKIGFVVLLCIVFLWAFYFVTFSDMTAAASRLIHRLFVTYPDVAYTAYAHFSTKADLLMGGSFVNPRGLLPFERTNFAVLIGSVHKDNALMTISNTSSFVEWFANFGFLGAVLFQIVIGLVLHYIFVWYAQSRRDVISSSVYSLLCVNFALMSVTYNPFLRQVLFVILIYLGVRFVLPFLYGSIKRTA